MVLLAQAVVVVLGMGLLHLPLEAGSQAINNSCPAVNITSHKAYASFSPQYDDPRLWIVLCTDLRDTNIACNWDYFGDPITRPHNASSRTDQTPDGSCTNCSLVLYNVTYADSDGHYTVDAMSSCGSRNSALFDLAVSGCPCGENPPEAYGIPNVLVVEADTPLNFTLPNVITFRGCANRNDFSARVSLPTGPICLDNQPYENFKCVRQDMNCRFTESLTIINPTDSNSGNYCAQALSNPGGGPDGNSTCFFLGIYPRPRITGPEILSNTRFRTSIDATLQWKVCNYSQALTIIASKNGANYTRVQIDNIVTEPDCRYVKVSGTAGTYELLVMFNTSVNPLGFKPISSIPGVVTASGIVGFPLVIIASLGIIVLLVLPVISVCYLKRRKKETDGSVSRRKKTTNRSESASKPLLQTDGSGVHGDQTSGSEGSELGSRREIHVREGGSVDMNAGISQVQVSLAGDNFDVFISYKHEPISTKCANTVAKHLTGLGYKVYLDESELMGGVNINKELTTAINAAPIFLPILSSAYMTESGELWCQRELDFAKLKNRKLLPVVIKGVEIPDDVMLTIGPNTMRLVYDPFDPSTGIASIARAVGRLLAKQPAPRMSPVGKGVLSDVRRNEACARLVLTEADVHGLSQSVELPKRVGERSRVVDLQPSSSKSPCEAYSRELGAPGIADTNGTDGDSGPTGAEGPLDLTGNQEHQGEEGPHVTISPAGSKGDKQWAESMLNAYHAAVVADHQLAIAAEHRYSESYIGFISEPINQVRDT